MELVPFWKVDRIIVEEVEMGEAEMKGLKPALDFRSFAVVLLKASGKRLTIGEVVTPDEDDLLQEAFGRAQDVAESVADIMQKPVEVTVETEEGRGARRHLRPEGGDRTAADHNSPWYDGRGQCRSGGTGRRGRLKIC